jgi:guanine deaminase
LQAFARGALAVDGDGRIAAVGEAAPLLTAHPRAERIDLGDALILPGFADAHLHFPQLDMIGCHGASLLEWLQRHTFPEEERSPTRPTPADRPEGSRTNCWPTA